MGEPVAVEVRVEVVQAVQMGFCVPCKTGETGLASIFPVRHLCDTVAKLSRQCRTGVVRCRFSLSPCHRIKPFSRPSPSVTGRHRPSRAVTGRHRPSVFKRRTPYDLAALSARDGQARIAKFFQRTLGFSLFCSKIRHHLFGCYCSILFHLFEDEHSEIAGRVMR